MKRLILPILFLITFHGFSIAQGVSFGLRAGLNLANVGGEDVKKFTEASFDEDGVSVSSNAEVTMRTGFHIGGYMNLGIGKKFSVEPGVFYSTKGFVSSSSFSLGDDFMTIKGKTTYTSSFIDIPVLARVEVVKGLSLFAGPQFSMFLGNETKTSTSFFGFGQSATSKDKEGINKMDLAASLGAGYQLPFGLNFNVGYDLGLNSLSSEKNEKDESAKVYNRVIKLSVGYRF